MIEAVRYLPTVRWTTIIHDVVLLTSETILLPATYRITVIPEDVNEEGARLAEKEINFFVKDFVGHIFRITAINVGGDPTRIIVSDDFRTGYGPQTGRTGVVYKSVAKGISPYIAPVEHSRLDKSALDYSRSVELDILYKRLYTESFDADTWLPNNIDPSVNFGVAIGQDNLINSNSSTIIGNGLISNSYLETVLGTYNTEALSQNANTWVTTDRLFTIGNGTSNIAKSIALELFKSGYLKVYNGLNIGEYSYGSIDPIDGTLQYKTNSLQIASGNIWYPFLTGFPQTVDETTTNLATTSGHTHILGEHKHDKLYQPDKTNPFVYTDNESNLNVTGIININTSGVDNSIGSLIINANIGIPASVPHPESTIHITGKDNTMPAIYLDSYGNNPDAGTYRGIINFRSARGTKEIPLHTEAGDELARISARGYNGSNFTGSLASISFYTAEQTTSTNQGSFLTFKTVPLGTVGGGSYAVPPEVVRVQPSGGMSIGDYTFNSVDGGNGSLFILNKLAIGTNIPSASLHAKGTFRLDGQIQLQTYTTQTGVSVSTNYVQALIQGDEFNNNTTSTKSLSGLIISPASVSSSSGTTSMRGITVHPRAYSTNSGAYSVIGADILGIANNALDVSVNSTLTGVSATAGHGPLFNPNTTTSSITAIRSLAQNTSGIITNSYGIQAGILVATSTNSVASSSSVYGINISGTVGAASGSGSGYIENYYDIYMSGITINTTGSITNKYGLYQPTTTHYNYLNSNLGLGYSTGIEIENNRLSVNGGGYFKDYLTSATINLITGAEVNYVWKCTNATTGAGQWSLISTSQTWKSTWDALTNTPTLADGIGTPGDFYTVSVAGTQNLGSGNITFAVNSTVSYNGTIWQMLPAPSITGAALTKIDDTNITLSLGGSPSTALVNATSITVGWTGTLADNRIASALNWNTAFDQTLQWDGGSIGLVASNGRDSLGGTTIGQSMFTLLNPSAITFPRFNADNTISVLSASDFRIAIGAGTSSATNLSYTASPTNGIVVSDNGSDATITARSNTNAGLMLPADKTKLDGIATGATNYEGWYLQVNSLTPLLIGSTNGVNFVNGTNVSITRSGNDITINSSGTNNYPTSLAFSSSTGILTLGRSGLSNLTTSLDGRYDYYGDWGFQVNGVTNKYVGAGQAVNFIAGTGITLNGGTMGAVTISVTGGGGSMVYPSVGIPISTGSAWGTSITNNSTNWNTAYSNMGKVALINNTSLFGYLSDTYFNISGGTAFLRTDVTVTQFSSLPITSGGAYTALSSKQNTLILTTLGTSGAATLIGATLNIPQYSGGGSMTYPGAGIALSTGSSWGTSITNNSSNWNTAYSWGNHSGLYLLLSGGALTGAVTSSSTFTASNFILNSDRRLKDNIKPIDTSKSIINFVEYTMKNTSEKRYGVIAQEVEKNNPELVRTNEDGIKSVAYIDLLILKIAELEERIKKLENG